MANVTKTKAIKIVKVHSKLGLISCSATEVDSVGKGMLLYTPGQVVVPGIKESKLFVFDCIESAEFFLGPYNTRRSRAGVGPYQFWHCECEGAEAMEYMGHSNSEALFYWTHLPKLPVILKHLTPKGTLGCDSLTLMERVVWRE